MPLLDHVRQDAAYAARALRREPGLTLGIVATFALAIGANAAMFGLVNRLLLAAPPGIAAPDRVVRVGLDFQSSDGDRFTTTTTSYPVFRALDKADAAFQSVAATRTDTVALGKGEELTEISTIDASGRYFEVLGVHPALGRFFTAKDDELPSGAPVVVLSHAYWARRFARDPQVINREIVLDGEPFTIIGVAPAGFTGDEHAPVDVFRPLTAAMRHSDAAWSTETGFNLVSIVARLRDGVQAPAAVHAAMTAVRGALAGTDRDNTVTGTQLPSLLPGAAARETAQGRTALWLSGVALVVLLIATANVGTLLLLRALRRRREIAVRIALGIGRARLARQLITESLLLALAGGAVGLVVANWLTDVIRATLLPNVTPADTFVDPRVLVATLVTACVAGLAAGCAPLVQLGRRDIIAELKTAGAAPHGRSVLRASLVGVQVALCTVLLVGAGLFVRSLHRVQAQDLGFSTANLLYVSLDFRGNVPGPDHDRIHREASARLASLSGVTSATIVEAMPFGPHHVPPISVPGMAEPPKAGGQLPMMYAATPEYLRMMQVSLRQGRLLDARDARGAPLVVLVNETMARTIWPGQSAIGRCIRIGFDLTKPPTPLAPASLPCREVVGVVRDSRARSLRPDNFEAKLMQYYVPFGQLPPTPFPGAREVSGLLVQVAGDADRTAGAIQRLIQGTSPVPVYARVRPYQDFLDPQLRSWRLGATLFTAFGVLALGIAAVGLFGVVSYLVTQRTREIGVRLALGGTRALIGRLVVGDALRMVSWGVGSGLVAAVALAPLVESMLFATSPREAAVLGGAGALLLAVTLVAAAVPAWRAARVSPLIALRAD